MKKIQAMTVAEWDDGPLPPMPQILHARVLEALKQREQAMKALADIYKSTTDAFQVHHHICEYAFSLHDF